METLDQSYYCGASTTQIIYETIGVYFDRICEQHQTKTRLLFAIKTSDGRTAGSMKRSKIWRPACWPWDRAG